VGGWGGNSWDNNFLRPMALSHHARNRTNARALQDKADARKNLEQFSRRITRRLLGRRNPGIDDPFQKIDYSFKVAGRRSWLLPCTDLGRDLGGCAISANNASAITAGGPFRRGPDARLRTTRSTKCFAGETARLASIARIGERSSLVSRR